MARWRMMNVLRPGTAALRSMLNPRRAGSSALRAGWETGAPADRARPRAQHRGRGLAFEMHGALENGERAAAGEGRTPLNVESTPSGSWAFRAGPEIGAPAACGSERVFSEPVFQSGGDAHTV